MQRGHDLEWRTHPHMVPPGEGWKVDQLFNLEPDTTWTIYGTNVPAKPVAMHTGKDLQVCCLENYTHAQILGPETLQKLIASHFTRQPAANPPFKKKDMVLL